MIPIVLCALAFLVALAASRRSLGLGLSAVLSVGYVYGIVRANLPTAASHMLFDCAVAGLYLGAGASVLRGTSLTAQNRALAGWTAVLIAWPMLLFFTPGYDPSLQAVGLRGNAFLLPFILIGSRLVASDLRTIALALSALNLIALSFGVAEYLTDVRRFFPINEVTRIIYASNDLVGYTAYRIPATFANAHAYAGTMVNTLPVLLGAFTLRHRTWWKGWLTYGGVGAAVIGVFLGAARTHAAILFLVIIVVTLSGQLTRRALMGWAAALVVIAGVVWSDERLQRFTELGSLSTVVTRMSWSVNDNVLEKMSAYPLGNGLAGGGTSIPYFLNAGNQEVVNVENEYARLSIEQGIPGLVMWLAFVGWVAFFPKVRRNDPWFVGRLAGWVVAVAYFATAFFGTGLFTSIPQTCLFLLSVGWVSVRCEAAERSPAAARPTPPPFRRGWRPRRIAADSL